MFSKALASSKTDQWWTPEPLRQEIQSFLGWYFDPCPRGEPEFNGLLVPWAMHTFCNPPYGRVIGQWTTKATQEYLNGNVEEMVLLLPARTDTRWLQPLLTSPLIFIAGRLHFGENRNSAPFPSVLIYLGFRPKAFHEAFGTWGVCLNG